MTLAEHLIEYIEKEGRSESLLGMRCWKRLWHNPQNAKVDRECNASLGPVRRSLECRASSSVAILAGQTVRQEFLAPAHHLPDAPLPGIWCVDRVGGYARRRGKRSAMNFCSLGSAS